MKKMITNHITSCTIAWEKCEAAHADEISRVITRILQTEIQVRFYDGYGSLISGRIWPMTDQQKLELFNFMDSCIHAWTSDDYSVCVDDGFCWQLKVCTKGRCLRTINGTAEPPPHGEIIKDMLAQIIGEENCYFC